MLFPEFGLQLKDFSQNAMPKLSHIEGISVRLFICNSRVGASHVFRQSTGINDALS